MSALSVVSVADRAGFYTFASALRASDHFATLESAGPFTVFAPTDAAFKKFPTTALDRLLNGERELLQVVLGYHFAAGRVATARLAGKRIRAVMQCGGDVIIDGRTAGLRVNAASLCKPDLNARNGVVHGIDALLWPRQATAMAGAS
jgi:uncharacterized surface protein with fasciclin (FAS1) repeats